MDMTDDRDIIREWASLELKLKNARREVLKANGHSESTYRSLRKDAATHLETCQTRETLNEYGLVYLNEDPIYLHQGSRQIGSNPTIHLKPKGEE